ncbi:hypothetical protein Poly30_52970 [Planctomycetes bacterium Poly30]|uniref:FG-GAP repeat protein n=1 Tax=Saltatorellus ferox TaxID=2528018 RepID=A0A518F071_9BACT|nr:hypothetical protein Poly30_52970 [Planctomycetes bacterium Poly30]
MLTTLLLAATCQSTLPMGSGDPFLWTDAIQAPAPQAGDQFGRSLAAGGDRAVISAWRRDSNTGGADVYRWDGSALVHEASLTPSDIGPGSMCGLSAHINEQGNVVVLSATGDATQGTNAGAVYVFRRHFATWVEEAKLLAPGGAESDAFGSSVAVGENLVVVGAPGVDLVPPGFYAAGAVYVFEFDATAWAWDSGRTIFAPDPDGGDRFGQEISLDGATFAVGCPQKDHGLGDNAGAVYLYSRQGGAWALEERLVTPGASAGTHFGRAVALEGDVLLASSVAGSMTGSVHVFRRGLAGWTEATRWAAPHPEPFDFFGESLALHGQNVMASGRKLGGVDAPLVHAYRLGGGASVEWKQLITQPLPTGSHVGGGSELALSDHFALIGEALHAQNLGHSPSYVDVLRPAPEHQGSGIIRSARR